MTNGNADQQRNKINNINWNGLKPPKEHIIFANEIGKKPDPIGVEILIERFSLRHEDILFIGDSETDRKCAIAANIKFLDVTKI